MHHDAAPPSAFISYSWESDDHKTWVRNFAERLTRNGVNVRLDQWQIIPGQSLTQFMEAEVDNCDFVLVICTKDYCRKSVTRAGGVGYEQQIITGNIVAGTPRERIIPIVREGDFRSGSDCSIPSQFRGVYAVDMRDGSDIDKEMELLLRALFKQPASSQPTIGAKPAFLTNAEKPADTEEGDAREEVRLAVLDLDGWHLVSGVACHHRWPETFEIPGEKERRGLAAGDTVKLQFEMSVPYDEDFGDTSNERMWVIVRGKLGPYYLGELDNVPTCSDEQDHLHMGAVVVFLPEHVISIHTSDGAEIHVEDDA